MIKTAVEILLIVTEGYLVAGVLFAIVFQFKAIQKVDHAAVGSSVFFRLLITPGLIALWPLMARKWARVTKGALQPGQPIDSRVSARQLRGLHGLAMKSLAVIFPLVLAAGLYWRAPRHTDARAFAEVQLTPAALPAVLSTNQPVFAKSPFPGCITANVRSDAKGGRQLEMVVTKDLEIPALGLFWSGEKNAEELPPNASFLGAVWGPGTRRFALPIEASRGVGHLYLIALAQGQKVVAVDDFHLN